MKLKVYKPVIAALLFFAAGGPAFAQVCPAQPIVPAVPAPGPIVISVNPSVSVLTKIDTDGLQAQLHELKTVIKNITVNTTNQVLAALNDVDVNVDLSGIDPQIKLDVENNIKAYTNGSKQNGDSEQVKKYSKSYSIDASDKLAIENRYGTVTVNTWAKNEFKVDVEIKADAGSDDEARKMLDNVSVSDNKEGSTVSFKTKIGPDNNSWDSWGGKHHVHKIEINYTVYMPARNDLTIDNRYGATELPDMEGKVSIYSAYGSFLAKSLTNQNSIIVKYGNAEIGNLGPTALEVSYGNLKLESADKLEANISYSAADIGKIRISGNINLKYSGGLSIGDVDRNMKNLAINSSYSNVKLGLGSDENTNFDVTTHYGGFDYDGRNVTITSKSPDDSDGKPHFTYTYKGYLGKAGTEKNITIYSTYGSVKFE